MRRHQIRYKILLLTELPVHIFICLHETIVDFYARFTKFLQYCITDVFRCYLQLSTHMMLTQFAKESVILIIHQIIETDSRTDEYFLNFRKFTQFA